jgi:hypothetical protein
VFFPELGWICPPSSSPPTMTPTGLHLWVNQEPSGTSFCYEPIRHYIMCRRIWMSRSLPRWRAQYKSIELWTVKWCVNNWFYDEWFKEKHMCRHSCGSNSDPCLVACVWIHRSVCECIQWLAHGADSNGSGVTILLELARLFQRLYSNASTRPQ